MTACYRVLSRLLDDASETMGTPAVYHQFTQDSLNELIVQLQSSAAPTT